MTDIREKYINGDLISEGDIIVDRRSETIHEVISCGTNYVTAICEKGEVSKHWIDDIVIANSLREDFHSLRRKRSSSNQVAFCGYKTKNFTEEHYRLFHPLIKEDHNKFVLVSLLRETDRLLEEAMDITEENHQKVKRLFEVTEKFLKKINVLDEHSYRSDIKERLNEYELCEGLRLTNTNEQDIARVIAIAVGVDEESEVSETVNGAAYKVLSEDYTEEALKIIGQMLNTATKSGIEWDKSIIPEDKQQLMQIR